MNNNDVAKMLQKCIYRNQYGQEKVSLQSIKHFINLLADKPIYYKKLRNIEVRETKNESIDGSVTQSQTIHLGINGLHSCKNYYEKLVCVIEEAAIVHRVHMDGSQGVYMSYPAVSLGAG